MKRAIAGRLLAALLVVPLAGAAPATALQPYTANYEVIRNGDTLGHATITLKPMQGGWDYESVTHGTNGLAALAAADIDEHSQVQNRGGVLQMLSYHYRLSTIVKSSERSITADPATNRVVIRDKKHEQEFPLQPGVLDQQSVTLAIEQDLANGKRGALSYSVAGRNSIATENYQVGKEQTVQVPAGSLRTLAVTRVRAGDSGRVTSSWFGLDNGFVPVRVVQTEPSGETLEMRLVSLKH